MAQLPTARGLSTKEWTFLFSDPDSNPAQLPPTFVIIIFSRYINNMKNNRTIRHVKCIRPAARLVNSGPNTTQSLPFFDHLIQLSSSVWPAARLVNSGLNRSQLSSISLCLVTDQHLRLLSEPLSFLLYWKLFYFFTQHSTDLKAKRLWD